MIVFENELENVSFTAVMKILHYESWATEVAQKVLKIIGRFSSTRLVNLESSGAINL